ncbi:MAG: hypothetical protein RIT24_783 [Planctomycetota bacterium]
MAKEGGSRARWTEGEERRRQFDRMARLARVYRGWTNGQLNDALGRSRLRPIADADDPKLDLVARLAIALDWELGEVAERMWGEADPQGSEARDASFAELDSRAQVEHRAGDFAAMEATARAMRALARTSRERAIAANRLAGALDGCGRYGRALEALRDALGEPDVGADVRLMLTVNVANANYTLWNLLEARALADGVLERFDAAPPRTRLERVAEAFGHMIRGHATRRMIARADTEEERRRHAERACRSLAFAEERYRGLAEEFGDPQYEGLARTALGGIIEARVAAGDLAPDEGLAEILAELDRFVDVDAVPGGQLIESAGWWAVFGANIAMRAGDPRARGISEDPEADRAFAVCTNKALEIGERLGHWPLRERAFTLEWFRRQVAVAAARVDPGDAWTLDREDLRALVGAMGRFPFFRPTGWAIIDSAAITA